MKTVKPSAELIVITPDAEKVIEIAGRVCYKSEDRITPESSTAFIRKIRESQHESVLEHASATFRIVCDRGVSHEIVRHRLASYSQESTRYCNYSKDKHGGEITVVEPPELEPSSPYKSDVKFVWTRAMNQAEDAYLSVLKAGVSPQIARSVLPTCLKTEIIMTANLREWRHFLRLRLSTKAHPQIREIAETIRQELVRQCPTVFEDIAGV